MTPHLPEPLPDTLELLPHHHLQMLLE